MSANPLFEKPVPIEAMMAVIRSGNGRPRVIRLEPELPVVERLTYPKEADVTVSMNVNPLAFLGLCALAGVAILFALAAYISTILGNTDCDCPSYLLRRQSGRGQKRKTYHLPDCPFGNKENA